MTPASGGRAAGGGASASGLAGFLAGLESAVTVLDDRGEEMEEKAETVVAPAGFVGSCSDHAVEFFVDEAAEVDFVLRALAGHAGRIGELDGGARAREGVDG